MSSAYSSTIPAHTLGNVVRPNIAGNDPGEKKASQTKAINFDSPECFITKQEGRQAQLVLAGLAFSKNILFQGRTLQEDVSEVLEACGLLQSLSSS